MTVIAIVRSGGDAGLVKVFASEEEAKNAGNGFAIYTSADDLAAIGGNKTINDNDMVALFNRYSEYNIAAFRNRKEGAKKLWALFTTDVPTQTTDDEPEAGMVPVDDQGETQMTDVTQIENDRGAVIKKPAKKPAKKAAPKKAAPKKAAPKKAAPKKAAGEDRTSKFAGKRFFTDLEDHNCREGSERYKPMEAFMAAGKRGLTYDAYIADGHSASQFSVLLKIGKIKQVK